MKCSNTKEKRTNCKKMSKFDERFMLTLRKESAIIF